EAPDLTSSNARGCGVLTRDQRTLATRRIAELRRVVQPRVVRAHLAPADHEHRQLGRRRWRAEQSPQLVGDALIVEVHAMIAMHDLLAHDAGFDAFGEDDAVG